MSTVTLGGLQKRAMQNIGRQGEANIINESGLYTLILRSNKPEAKPFRKWVTSEVLPSIRKTGTYHQQPRLQFIQEEVEALIKMAKLFGLNDNQALLSANNATIELFGMSPMHLLKITHITTESKEIDLTPTTIGTIINKTARQVNKLLIEHGFQKLIPGNRYIPTEKGTKFAVLKDTNKRYSNGTPILQLFWKHGVIEYLC